jgi:hypothetical protein
VVTVAVEREPMHRGTLDPDPDRGVLACGAVLVSRYPRATASLDVPRVTLSGRAVAAAGQPPWSLVGMRTPMTTEGFAQLNWPGR